jgi:hypothetical protein
MGPYFPFATFLFDAVFLRADGRFGAVLFPADAFFTAAFFRTVVVFVVFFPAATFRRVALGAAFLRAAFFRAGAGAGWLDRGRPRVAAPVPNDALVRATAVALVAGSIDGVTDARMLIRPAGPRSAYAVEAVVPVEKTCALSTITVLFVEVNTTPAGEMISYWICAVSAGDSSVRRPMRKVPACPGASDPGLDLREL